MIRGTDGLDYKDITEKLLGNPAKTERNAFILRLSGGKIYSREFILARADYYEARGDFHTVERAKSTILGKRAHTLIVDDLCRSAGYT